MVGRGFTGSHHGTIAKDLEPVDVDVLGRGRRGVGLHASVAPKDASRRACPGQGLV